MPALLPVGADTHLSLNRTAQALDVSRQRVLSFTAAGALSATVMGGRLFFERDKVEALRQQLAAGKAPPARTAKRGRSRA